MGLGKWILGGLGWSIGGPIGALLGFGIGSLFEKNDKNGTPRKDPQINSEGDLLVALMVLVAAVMKADGVVKKSELDYVKQFLRRNFGDDKSLQLLSVLRDVLKQDIPVAQVCQQIKDNTDYSTRYHVMDFLVGLAAADYVLDPAEDRMLTHIRVLLGIQVSDYLSMRARYGSASHQSASSSTTYTKDPYKVLGLERTATDDEVKSAYRRFAMKYHPDKVEHLGEELKKNAEAQFREINEAYEAIKAERGIK